MRKFYHPYHLVRERPWPLIRSFSVFFIIIGVINWLRINFNYLLILNFILLFFVIFQWWRDVVRERTLQGNHTLKVLRGLQMGIILFIVSEIIFFLSFFWAYFHLFLSPRVEVGSYWPPIKIIVFNPYNVPLLNTLILLRSGVRITWGHYIILRKKYNESNFRILLTVILGILFTFFQYLEYRESYFSISDSSYGRIFFIATGFHGIHVLIGTVFIFISLNRINKIHFSEFHHFGFEAASWYWHFVDVVWLFLYIFIYWFTY